MKQIKDLYERPLTEVLNLKVQMRILESSVSGGHNPAEDDETLEAKENYFFEDETVFPKNVDVWDD